MSHTETAHKHRRGGPHTALQTVGVGFTHNTTEINNGHSGRCHSTTSTEHKANPHKFRRN